MCKALAMRIGILGGTGPAGTALGARLASVGYEVVLGSRSAERAAEVRDEILAKLARPAPSPRSGRQRRRRGRRPRRAGHPVGQRGHHRSQPSPTVWRARSSCRWATRSCALGHRVPAARAAPWLGRRARPGRGPGGRGSWPPSSTCPRTSSATWARRSTPTCSSAATTPTPRRWWPRSSGRSLAAGPLDAGELSNATAIEAFTAVLLQLNVRYKTRVAPKLTGIKPT